MDLIWCLTWHNSPGRDPDYTSSWLKSDLFFRNSSLHTAPPDMVKVTLLWIVYIYPIAQVTREVKIWYFQAASDTFSWVLQLCLECQIDKGLSPILVFWKINFQGLTLSQDIISNPHLWTSWNSRGFGIHPQTFEKKATLFFDRTFGHPVLYQVFCWNFH